MTADATLPLQAAIIAALKGDAAVAAIVSGRIYDRPPPEAVKPYVSFGVVQALPETADEYDGAEITVQLDVWSAKPTTVEAKRIGAAIRAALHGADLAITGHRLVSIEIEQARYITEPDGLTQHAVLIFTARTEPV
ncbi:hypothetical protein RHODGE_RHODGE_02829 [Rhodoplanes serenus]|uniref:DUF3168 domain-containing protein n=1 Tax=Rhodoplanes serenus TaxID=200615 RepID=A0A447CWI7_9BRAD|nr:DUF3168 domain-containing protein [Rhodoplanes serenus]VCU09660.1 hypothetical protein RHODGE_RHODGE_02829 [Rhodoplanes serenus]